MRWGTVFALGLALSPAVAGAEGLEVVWAAPDVPVRSYVIERRVEASGQGFGTIVHIGSTTLRFVDESVSPGVRYCYRVRSVRTDGTSSASQALCANAGPRVAPHPEKRGFAAGGHPQRAAP